MQALDRTQFTALLKEHRVKPRLVRDLRFIPEEIENWKDLDMLAIATRSGSEGLLFVQTDKFYMLPYELSTRIKDNSTGRSKPITCDFCYTWQQGGKSGRITFTRERDGHKFTYLCCADLRCSLHVRNKTPEAAYSRTQLHEDITTKQRIARLKKKVGEVIKTLDVQPISFPTSADD